MLFYHPDLKENLLFLSPEESQHIAKVLRLKNGDKLQLTDGKGTMTEAIVIDANLKKCQVEINSRSHHKPDPYHIHIAISPTKNLERINWFVEKAVEIGIHEISFIRCTNSVRPVIKTDKLIAKSISALKQCQRPFLPVINEMKDFIELIKEMDGSVENFICHLQNNDPEELINFARKNCQYLVLVGPEGDFTANEIDTAIDKGFKMVKLGNYTLRTETAALHACSILNAINY